MGWEKLTVAADVVEPTNAEGVDGARAVDQAADAVDGTTKAVHFAMQEMKGQDEDHQLVLQLTPW
jgi:hypothetical protein